MNSDLCICSSAKTEWKDDFVFLWYSAEKESEIPAL